MNLNYNSKYKDKTKENFIKDFANNIYKEKILNKYYEIVFLCIGTDRLIGDCFGPLVGTKLNELLETYNIFNINIYGTLKKNICYTNIEDMLKKIQENHTNACIVVIDAALSNNENIGKIYVERKPVILAKGLHKPKIEVGNISIKAVVGRNYKLSKYNFLSLQNVSLMEVMNLSEIVANGIFEVIKYV